MKTKILILGGNGFIGSSLIDRYIKINDYSVYATFHHNINKCNHKIKYIYCDLTDRSQVDNLFKNVVPDIVIHASAFTSCSKDTIEKPYIQISDNNIINTLVFEHCHKYKIKHCIFFSCSIMYQSKKYPQSELDWKISDELSKVYFGVAHMKILAEKLCEFYSVIGDTKYTCIRHSNVYGPNDKVDINKCHVLSALIQKTLMSEREIEIWGDGTSQRDMIFIDDLIDFVDACIKKQKKYYELLNCGTGKAYSVNEIFYIIQEILHKNLEIKYNTQKPNISHTVILNCDKAKNILNWVPKKTLKEGLSITVPFYIQKLCL